MEKQCFKCGTVKPLTEFYKHSMMADGHLGKCKTCTRQDTREREAKLLATPEGRESEATRHREKSRRYRQDGRSKPISPEDKKKAIDKYNAAHPERKKASQAVGNALRSGKLTRHPCHCGNKAQAHHSDYSKPLDVEWLCPKHHADADRKRRELETNDQN